MSAAGVPDHYEARYFVSGLPANEVSPEGLMRRARGHRCIEDGLHFIEDRWRDEDRRWSTRPGLAERLAAPRDAALTA